MNHFILFSNIKGGVGKSTICTLFAHWIASKGEDVAVVDDDSQRTIARQRKRDKDNRPDDKLPWEVYSVFDYDKAGDMTKLLPVLKSQDGWILVDCPGNLETERLVPVLQAADAIVIPTSYGANDLDATIELFVPVLRQLNKSAKFIFLPNMISEDNQKEREEAKRQRDKAWDRVHGYGVLTARIKKSIVFDNKHDVCRVNTIDGLNHWQDKGVKHAFEDLCEALGVELENNQNI
jgi:chromosome partitioning protein